jgi:hypothetical protein
MEKFLAGIEDGDPEVASITQAFFILDLCKHGHTCVVAPDTFPGEIGWCHQKHCVNAGK